MYTYEIEPLYGNKPVELMYEVHYSYCPGDRSTPEYEECFIESIKHKGKEVKPEVLERLFSIHHGCHMTLETILQMILEDWDRQIKMEAEDQREWQAYQRYQDMKEEGLL